MTKKEAKKDYRVFTASKKKYEELSTNLGYKNQTLFDLAAAIGISRNELKESSSDWEELLNLYSVDKDEILRSILKLMYKEEEEHIIIKKLQEHAEAGIDIIYNDWNKTGNFDIDRYYSRETIEWED